MVPRLGAQGMLCAPPWFNAAGDLYLLKESVHRVAVIGSRDTGELGLKRASRIARELVEQGIVVVSGLAKGIDRAAHDAAISAGGRTIAVIGTPLDRCYPAEHSALQECIYRKHLLVSQFPNGARTYPSHFVERNRFMALIADATVVVDAGDSSGTLSQAAETARLGKPLFIMASILERNDISWPEKFLSPKQGKPAIVLRDVSEVRTALP